ncbi:arrestin domain-containing protein 2-like isoform X2 [Eupeodes corollae]|uniref:arrestin domain-containing protein 2-like isoform X2 n=1 Tax=Eupeodes corollae TaxID=290404 RepID=UPI002491B1E8|nr:arrestin domain-containing protein 2-like isoform X2 [Eupeodes corollae]
MTSCQIVFDKNDHGTFFTGQIVSGIQLKICGFSSATWKDRRSGAKKEHHHKKRRFSGREDYISSNTFLKGSDTGQEVIVEPGSHVFTFQCLIPENCPSSFEGKYGHIRYVAKVIMINSLSKNHAYTVGFTVLKLLDLNWDSSLLKMPANIEAIEGFCLSTAKPVLLSVDITQTGYVPGQMILVSGEVNNQSNCDAKKINVYLNLKATYTSDCPRTNFKTEKICLVKKESSPVARRSRRNFTEIIRVPATAPTCEHLSKIVRISYEISVVAVMNGFIRNAKAVIPITIGNVPLHTASIPAPRLTDVPSTSASAMALAGGCQQENTVSETIEPELPPPSYEEAMFMTADIADDELQSPNGVRETVRFTPRFPVFDVDGLLMPDSIPSAPPAQTSPVIEKPIEDDVKYLI